MNADEVIAESCEEETPPDPGPAKRPWLGKRQGRADRLMREFATHEWGTVRAEVWYPAEVSAFNMKTPRAPEPSKHTIARVEQTGKVLLQVKGRWKAHWYCLMREYLDDVRMPVPSLRLALDAFATEWDAWAPKREE